jgi:branched-chain amino acid transport system substrate-binding protein
MRIGILAGALVGAASIVATLAPSKAEIRIGIVGPFSASPFVIGEEQRVGAGAAIRDLNDRGGVLGEKIVATSVDDGCDPEQAKAAARQLVSEHVVLVVGHVCSADSIAASPII